MHSARLALVLLVLCGFVGSLGAQQPFTYQGMLRASGIPAHGNYDLQFSLWNAASGGAQVGSTVTRIGVSVSNGLFTTELDFGNVWDGSDRHLQIAVRPSGSGAYTTLSPRVRVHRAPYSQLAYTALSVPWSGITGIPAGFADGVDNDTTYAAGAGLQLSGNTFSIASGGVTSAMLADGSVVTSKLADGAVSSAKIADGAVTTAKIANGAVTDAKLSNTGVSAGTYGGATQVPQITVNAQGRVTSVTNVAIAGGAPSGPAGGDLTGTYPNPTIAANAVNNAKLASDPASLGKVSGGLLYTDGSFLGLGTTTPIGAGRFIVANNTSSYAGMYVQTTSSSGGQPFYGYATYLGGIGWHYVDGNDGHKWKLWLGGAERLTVTLQGQVGINTTNPQSALHVVTGAGTDAAQIIQTGNGRGLLVQAGQDTAIWGVTGSGYAGVDGRGLLLGVQGFAYGDTGVNVGGRFVTASPEGHGLEAFSLSGYPQTVARLSTTYDMTLTRESGLRVGGTGAGLIGLYGLNVDGLATGVIGESEQWNGVGGWTRIGRGVFGGQMGSDAPYGIGVWGYAASARGMAVRATNVQNGPALAIEGQIVVPDANVSSTTPVFKHVASRANIVGHVTYIDHPMCNGDPTAMLFITHDWGTAGPYVTRATGVWYDRGRGQWSIFHEDSSAMPVGAIFNVLVVKSVSGGTLRTQSTEDAVGAVAPEARR